MPILVLLCLSEHVAHDLVLVIHIDQFSAVVAYGLYKKQSICVREISVIFLIFKIKLFYCELISVNFNRITIERKQS